MKGDQAQAPGLADSGGQRGVVKIPLREKMAYGVGDTALTLVMRTLMVFLPFYYTDVFGISASAVGVILLVSRFGDGISDCLIGAFADRTESRWGKFRPWLLFGTLPLAVLIMLVFVSPDLDENGKLIYAAVTFNALLIGFTALFIPYSALSGVMTLDSAERTYLNGYRFSCGFLGAILTQGLTVHLVAFLGQGDKALGYRWTMILFAVISAGMLLLTFSFTRERVKPLPRQRLLLRQDLKDLFTNRPWIILFVAGISFVSLSAIKLGATVYYFNYYLESEEQASLFMILGILAALLGSMLAGKASERFSKHRVFVAGLLIQGALSGLLYFAGRDDLAMVYVLGVIVEGATGLLIVTFFAMLADAADFSEWKRSRRATGLVFAAGSMSGKFGLGIGGAVIGWTLNSSGYVANAVQDPGSLQGIRALFTVMPALAATLGLGAFAFYPLKEPVVLEIQRALEKRHAAAESHRSLRGEVK